LSPRVRLVLHPESDPAFAAQPALRLVIDLPGDRDPADLIAAIEHELHATYPAARIEVGERSPDGTEVVWHVYREGPPETGGPAEQG
jgi:hypothetical protein